ncbi:uncharacterized protein LODBEIA_P60430 [Lodderomyces beijingensis]|uniref:RRM domain-containing protein n=1 Tax=Lodderomyces beijingensis TaxID=1775926 RepID=A0ABP0ZUK0_9ASCO
MVKKSNSKPAKASEKKAAKAAPAKEVEAPVEKADVKVDNENLDLPSSSEEEEEEEDEQIYGLSSDESEDEEENPDSPASQSQRKQQTTTTSGHKVTKSSAPTTTTTATSKSAPKSSVIYIGRLPQHFQEHELRTYFTQFGPITNLKLSRNKKTGKSKHFAHIEFEQADVARVAAETMNNYLLFGHLVRCEVVAEPHKDTFKNSNRKFRVVPVHKIVKERHDGKKTREEWSLLVAKFEDAKKRKVAELKSKGIDYDLSQI